MKKRMAFILVAIVWGLASCTLTMDDTSTALESDLTAYRDSYLSSFDVMNDSAAIATGRAFSPFGRAAAGPSRATVPSVSYDSLSFADVAGGSANGSRADYPEAGQTSTWTVETTAQPAVYLVKVRTQFPSKVRGKKEPRDYQDEWYYIKDVDPVGDWTAADPVVDSSGGSAPTFRVKNELHYKDGSIQDETIVHMAWNADSWNLSDSRIGFPKAGAFLPSDYSHWIPASYSSVVFYTRDYESKGASLKAWKNKKASLIVGIRYYTERTVAGELLKNTLAFERVFETKKRDDLPGSFIETLRQSLSFNPSALFAGGADYLAQSLLRQEENTAAATIVTSALSYLDLEDSPIGYLLELLDDNEIGYDLIKDASWF